jgi:hypothetical protein
MARLLPETEETAELEEEAARAATGETEERAAPVILSTEPRETSGPRLLLIQVREAEGAAPGAMVLHPAEPALRVELEDRVMSFFSICHDYIILLIDNPRPDLHFIYSGSGRIVQI